MEIDRYATKTEQNTLLSLSLQLSKVTTGLEEKEIANHALLMKVHELRTKNLIKEDRIEHLEHLLTFFIHVDKSVDRELEAV